MSERGPKQVQATVNSFRILERLVDAGRAMGVTELADAVNLSKGVVHNHLATLSELGYVTKSERAYLPSFGLLALGEETRRRLPRFEQVRRRIDNLARVTGEVSTLFVEENGIGICVSVALGGDSWTPNYTAGSRMPLHVNAPGKAILASLDRTRVDEIVDEHGLVGLTEETVTDRETLDTDLKKARETGISFSRGEQSPDVVGASAPIDLGKCAPAAAVGICGPGENLTGRRFREDIAGQVISTARSVQADMTK